MKLAPQDLQHNVHNPVTASIARVVRGSGTVIRKVLTSSSAHAHPDWSASTDPTHPNYWRRELEVYTSPLADQLRGTGVRLPALLEVEPLPGGDVALWLEDVPGRSGAQVTERDARQVATAWGRAQALLQARPLRTPWASRQFARRYAATKQVDEAWLRDENAWRHPLVTAAWPTALRAAAVRLHSARHRLFDALESAPRALCHLDLWAHNVRGADGIDVTVIDWACAGDGALGEDIAHWVAEAGLDQLVPAEQVRSLGEALFDAYVDGLREGGWTGDRGAVRRGFTAAAAKFHWMPALLLERAHTGSHHRYGGDDDPDPLAHLRARGLTMAALCAWADEALPP